MFTACFHRNQHRIKVERWEKFCPLTLKFLETLCIMFVNNIPCISIRHQTEFSSICFTIFHRKLLCTSWIYLYSRHDIYLMFIYIYNTRLFAFIGFTSSFVIRKKGTKLTRLNQGRLKSQVVYLLFRHLVRGKVVIAFGSTDWNLLTFYLSSSRSYISKKNIYS